MDNMINVIKSHNLSLLNDKGDQIQKPCNCRNKQECPLNGDCRQTSIIYKATVKSNIEEKYYFGLTAGEFKTRYYNHTLSFRTKPEKAPSELAKYIWTLKDKNIDFKLHWNIVARSMPYKGGTRKCDLCLMEKLYIATSEQSKLLNKKSELISKCRHRNKFYLKFTK